jgi:hypothetical protein
VGWFCIVRKGCEKLPLKILKSQDDHQGVIENLVMRRVIFLFPLWVRGRVAEKDVFSSGSCKVL